MARVLTISSPPPPLVPAQKIEASHYRAWQFLHGMRAGRHTVALCACVRPGQANDITADPSAWSALGLERVDRITFGRAGWVAALQRLHDAFAPDCIVAVGYDSALAATKLRSDRPQWMDMYGDQLTIQQAYCRRAGSDRGLPTTIRFVAAVLECGDVFSACGELQKHVTVGELAACGRLNHRTFEYPFVHVILPGSPPADGLPALGHSRDVVRRELGVGPGDCVVLWCGGYNTWTDVETLFHGVEQAMAKAPWLHYVSIGASTYRAPDSAYERLMNLVSTSPHRDRYHMLGWRPWTDIPEFYRASEFGLNIDALHYETLYGTRTRLVEMIAAGLPVVTSQGTELSALLTAAGAASTFPPGDHAHLTKALLLVATDPQLRDRMAAAAERAARGPLSFEQTTAPLRDWLQSPRAAPDRSASRLRRHPISARHRLRALARLAAWRLAARPG